VGAENQLVRANPDVAAANRAFETGAHDLVHLLGHLQGETAAGGSGHDGGSDDVL
jgi:hypothetical protein